MKRNAVETILGAVVILGALLFLMFSYKSSNVADMKGYRVSADFSDIGGLKIGDEVQVSGVKVGQVAGIDLDPKAYLARVTIEVANNIKLPSDTAALISSTSLLGGKYLSLEPGGAEDFLGNGGKIQFTQAPQNLEQLLGKFIFSMQGKKGDDAASGDKPDAPAPAAAPAPAPAQAPTAAAPAEPASP